MSGPYEGARARWHFMDAPSQYDVGAALGDCNWSRSKARRSLQLQDTLSQPCDACRVQRSDSERRWRGLA